MKYLYLSCLLLFCINLFCNPAEKVINSIYNEAVEIARVDQEISHYRSLLEKKDLLVRLYQSRQIKEIFEHFRQDEEVLRIYIDSDSQEKLKDKYKEVEHLYGNMQGLSSPRFPLIPRLQYYEACVLTKEKKFHPARKILENLLVYNLDPANRNSLVVLLEEVYFELNRYDDIISVYPLYRGVCSEKQRWWLGQSLYNTQSYQKAMQVLRNLHKSKEYGLRASALTALIKYNTGNQQDAIKDFKFLKYKYSPEDPWYNFLNLSLARLYALEGENKKAVLLFDQYLQLEEEVCEDILYEIAIFYRNAGEQNQAAKYLEEVYKRREKSNLKLPAQYFSLISEQDKGKSSGIQKIDNILKTNDQLMQLLNIKFKILEEFVSYQNEENASVLEIYTEIEKQYFSNNKDIQALRNSSKDKPVQFLEQEMLRYSTLIIDYYMFAEKLQNLGQISNREMEYNKDDSLQISIDELRFTEHYFHKTGFKKEDAVFFADKKVCFSMKKLNWEDLSNVYNYYDLSEKINQIEVADSLINAGLNEIESWLIGERIFTKEKIDRAKIDIQEYSIELDEMFYTCLNDLLVKLTPILYQEIDDLTAELNQMKLDYIHKVTSQIEQLSEDNEYYQNLRLELMYRKSVNQEEFPDQKQGSMHYE